MTNFEKLIAAGCTHKGNILIPPVKGVVPVDIRRLNGWTSERVDRYIKDFR